MVKLKRSYIKCENNYQSPDLQSTIILRDVKFYKLYFSETATLHINLSKKSKAIQLFQNSNYIRFYFSNSAQYPI